MASVTAFLQEIIGETEVKVIYVLITVFTGVISLGLLVGLIYYELNMDERIRTLINKTMGWV